MQHTTLLVDLVRTAPLRVVVDLNEACNLRCSYCHVDALFRPIHKNSRELSLNAFTKIVREADEMQVFDLTLTGGEISTMPKFVDYLQTLSLLNFATPHLITNGTTLTERTISYYRHIRHGRISMSIDGFHEHNDSMRGKGSFDRTCRGMRTAIDAGWNVNIISVLTAANYQEWFELSAYLKEQGVASHNLSFLCRLGRAEGMAVWLGLNDQQTQWLMTDYMMRSRTLNSADYQVSLNTGALHPGTWSGIPLPVHQVQDLMPGTEAVIKVNGDIHTNRLVGKNRPIGNIYQASLKEIWTRSEEVRLQTAALIVADPDTNANGYYHLRAKAIVESTTSSDFDGTPSRQCERIRSLQTGQQLQFNPANFTLRLA